MSNLRKLETQDGKMVCQVKMLAANPADVSSIPRAPWWKEELILTSCTLMSTCVPFPTKKLIHATLKINKREPGVGGARI